MEDRKSKASGAAAEDRAPAMPEAPETPDAAAPAEERSPEQRVLELEAALAAAKAEAAENRDKFLRERAEMENYKKRIERTYADLAKQGRKELLLKVVAAVDNLERALAYEPSSTGQEAELRSLVTGLRMTYLQFTEMLKGEGLTEVKTVGQQFDPALHEAIATEVSQDRPEGEIVGEVQKGYTYGDELLRPARVRVATKGE